MGKQFTSGQGIEHPSKETLDYWGVGSIEINHQRKEAKAKLYGYIDKAKKDAGGQHLDTRTFETTSEEDYNSLIGADVFAGIYAKVDVDSEFTSASDVYEEGQQ